MDTGNGYITITLAPYSQTIGWPHDNGRTTLDECCARINELKVPEEI
jgi:hypothetical protein